MGKRRQRGRTRGFSRLHLKAIGAQKSNCDLSEWATLATKSYTQTNLLPVDLAPHRFDSSPNPSWLLMFLLHLLSLSSLVGASQVDGDNALSSPVILKSEQKQLFRGLHHIESELDQSAQDVISFLGIRYASAPTRRLRFMPPSPFNYAPNQVHDARHLGPICMQRFPVDFNAEQRSLLADLLPAGGSASTAAAAAAATTSTNKLAPADYAASKLRAAQLELMDRLLARPAGRFRQLLELEQSEDCLNLDIHVPLEGATISGARRFAAMNGLLVVTFNYRLNLLGFPPKLTGGASGNARTNLGLLDQVALLHWLQANIRSFGGAPRNVTLLAAGRGAILVNLLMVSPLAKGLFQRAIIEGSTALSPTLANSFPQQQQVGLQHLRLLATMADCSSNGAAVGATIDPLQLMGRNSSADDLRRHFECLKLSPAETLVQPIPVGLLEPAAAPGELVLARRWHRPLELLLRNLLELDQSLVATEARRGLNELANRIISSEDSSQGNSQPQPQQQLVQLTTSQLNRLIVQLVATRQSIGSQPGAADSSVQRVGELLDELLGAIYLPSNETLTANPFGPQLEPGTLLVHEENDLMSSMLQSHSPFGQQDLLIGSPSPLLNFNQHESSHNAKDGTQLEETLHSDYELPDLTQPSSSELLHSNERLAARITRQTGLTDEQAIQQVGLFVRTHFRYHQQEIANSIISNYFLGDQLVGSMRNSRLTNSSSNRSSDPTQVNRLKQMQLLKSLASAYEDSLVSVPLVKTALVHSLKQLERLADLFARQQIYRLNELLKETPAADVPKLLADEQRKLAALKVDFLNFAQQLYNQTAMWPLDELWPRNETSTSEQQQPHSTFFYQVERLDSLIGQVKSVIKQLDQKTAPDGSQVGAKGMANIKANLRNNLLKWFENKGHFVQQLSLGCALFDWEEAQGGGDDLDLLKRLLSLVCDRMGQQVVASFVIGGNVNRRQTAEGSGSKAFAVQLEEYEMECIRQDSFEQPDHHLVQPGEPLSGNHHLVNSTVILIEPTSTPNSSPSCRSKLNELTLKFLVAELDQFSSSKERRVREWPVFNLFSQQLASVGGLHAPIWLTESLADWRGPARERFDRKIAFWANFLPTLNCSRTQPLGANALAQANNSTLLNMNLNFHCHQGARTASSLMQSMETKMSANVAEWIGAQQAKQQQLWRIANVQTLSTQNHHSLRMATTNESQLDELNLEAERQLNRSAGGFLAPESVGRQFALDRRLVSLFTSWGSLLGVWLICGALLAASTLLAAGCALARHLRKDASKQAPKRKLSAAAAETENPPKFAPANSIETHSGELVLSGGPYLSETVTQTSNNFANYNNEASPLKPQRGFLDYPVEPQKHRTLDDGAEGSILLPIISTSHYFAQPAYQRGETQYQAGCKFTDTSQITLEQQQQQQPIQVLSSSSDTTTITNRPQSSVSLVSASTNTTNQTNNDTKGPSRHQAASKKRVQISDPKRLLEADYMRGYQQQQVESQMFLTGSHGQMASTHNLSGQPVANGANFCPVHRASSSNYLLQSINPPLEYEASTAFLTNEPGGGGRYLETVHGTQATFGQPAVATIGSLADYLNLLTPQQADEVETSDLVSNSLRYNSQPRSNKRPQTRRNSSGLCKMHSGQTMGSR